MTIQLTSKRTRQSALKCLILLGIAWNQVAYASHPFLHGFCKFDGSGEPCRACMSLERLERALDITDTPVLPPKRAAGEPTGTIGPGSSRPVTVYSARVSPQRVQ